MCRIVAYLGPEVVIEEVLIKPVNSLLAQSLHARETMMPTNGDGFGLGWYKPEVSERPGLYSDVRPAWNDRNLKHLARHIKSKCFFSHVRASSGGGITEYNCHPFSFGPYLFMHNGVVGNFHEIKRELRRRLTDEFYNSIKGETDSEHVFALFLQNLKPDGNRKSLSEMKNALASTITEVLELVAHSSENQPSNLNLCVSDGEKIVASRITTNTKGPARSLHYASGEQFHFKDGTAHMTESPHTKCIIIASEELNDFHAEWNEIKESSLICVDKDFTITTSDFKV